jgi:uncharacterized protein YyaL (SSP411 family)
MARANRLGQETSPYLLQHAHNPVDWYPWGDEAFERAKAENKPVLLSIGYSSCHWCHVMERESFEDPAIAALMNEHFVSIKVDREERPDVDDVYMKAVQLLIGRGGWPLTAFLSPDRKPFHGGTYFPPTDRHGLPGFPRVLLAVAKAYRERPEEIARATSRLVAGVESLEAPPSAVDSLDPELPARAAAALLRHVDGVHGGLGGAPKFPHTQAFQLLLRQHVKTGRSDYLDAVRLTCERMASGGMYDQIGGGFHRYSVDERWLVPHFEKMLYDNAQLSRLYLEAHQVTGDPALARVVTQTLDYVLREMRDPGGSFYSATDADSEGEEGKYFVWTLDEVRAVVGADDADLVCRYWDITEEGNFEGRSIAHVTVSVGQLAKTFGRSPEQAAAAIDAARRRLYEARQKRVPPLRDEKIITAWNALMISGLAEAGRVLGQSTYVDAAAAAAEFVWSRLRRDGRLLHVWAQGVGKQSAFLDDHAFLMAALVDLYEATGDRLHLDRAVELTTDLETHFRDERGGYFFTPDDGEALITRSKAGTDGALPSGNAVAALVHQRLHALTGDDHHRERAEEILRLYHAAAAEQPFAYATYLEALELYAETPTEVVIVGKAGDPDARALEDVVRRTYLPHRALVRVASDDPKPPAPALGRPARGGRATAYVCRNFTCSEPTTDPEALAALLDRPTRP